MDTLFRLVKSMQKSEKRFFRLQAARHFRGTNHSLLLFEAIGRQKEFNDKILRKQFAGTSLGRHFAFNKQYLYKQILRSLHLFHRSSSAENRIREQIHMVQILFDRRLLDACDKILEKSIREARSYELYPELMRLLEWKMELMAVRLFRGYNEKDLHSVEEDLKAAMDDQAAYINIYLRQRNLYFHSEHRGLTLIRKKKLEYRRDAVQLSGQSLKGFRANIFREYFLELVNRNIAGDETLTEQNGKNILKLTEDYPQISRDNPRFYLTTIYNLGVHRLFIRDIATVQKLADRLKTFADSVRLPVGLRQSASHYHAILQLGVYRGRFRYDAAEKYYRDFIRREKSFTGLEPNLPRLKVIHYIMGSVSFSTGHYREAIRHLSEITSIRNSKERQDIEVFARLMQLLSFFESGQTLSLETMSRSIRKNLVRHKDLYRIEKNILDFVSRNTPHRTDRKRMDAAYLWLKTSLESIRKNGSREEKIAFEYVDLIEWAASGGKGVAPIPG